MMYTRRLSRGRLGNFEGIGVSALGNQAPASTEQLVTAIDKGKQAAGGFLDLIKTVLPTAGAVYTQQQQLEHQQWLIKQGLSPSTPISHRPTSTTQSGGGSSALPMIIGVGAVAVVAFMFLGKKK